MSHSTKSRAEELKFMARFLLTPQSLILAFETNPNGGWTELEGINFIWGNVSGLLPPLRAQVLFTHEPKLLEWKPKHIYHLDNLSKVQEKLIVQQFNIRSEALSFHSNKADVLLVDANDRIRYVSIKDQSALTKLGQVANKEYGSTKLTGGFVGVDLDHFNCPDNISYTDTWLDENQWNKIGSKDRKCAYIKRQYPIDWKLVVDKGLNAAYQCLNDFAVKIKDDKDCICQFILLTLVGASVPTDNFHIAFGSQIIDVQRLLQNVKTMEFDVTSERYVSQGNKRKESLIVWLVFPGKKYCLTKIEPAFDGGSDVRASQTKGIQYYFQHWPTKSDSVNPTDEVKYDFKQFLLDVSQ